MTSTGKLTLDFAMRMVNDLESNNVLRGSWAEQLVAHYLAIDYSEMPPNWSYYDMRYPTPSGETLDVSVKHSVGPRASFSVAGSRWAWDYQLRLEQPATEGWRGTENAPWQYWCHAYVFAWLDHPDSAPPLDTILSGDRWSFAVLSRAQMYATFVNGDRRRKTARLSTISSVCDELSLPGFQPGSALPGMLQGVAAAADGSDGAPPRDMTPYVKERLGVPVTPVGDDAVPETELDSDDAND